KAESTTRSDAHKAQDNTSATAIAATAAAAGSDTAAAAGSDTAAGAGSDTAAGVTSGSKSDTPKNNTSSAAPRSEPSTQAHESFGGAAQASKSEVGAGAANQGGFSHGDTSASHAAAANASVSH